MNKSIRFEQIMFKINRIQYYASVILVLLVLQRGYARSVDEPIPDSAHTESAGSIEQPAAQPIQDPYLRITNGSPGGTAKAKLGFEHSENVLGFNLLLESDAIGLFSATSEDFRRNGAYFPEVNLGDHALNSVRDAGPGRIRIIGLEPAPSIGPVEVGQIHFHVSPDAPIGATQAITLTGEVNYADQGVVAIEPVIATFMVIGFDEKMYLPMIFAD